MTREETSRIIALIQIAYPQTANNLKESDLDLKIDEWTFQFRNDSYQSVYKTVQYYISTNKYPPTIADIHSMKFDIMNRETIPDGETAWELIVKSARCQREYAREQYEQLPEFLKKMVTIEMLVEIGYSNQESLIFMKNSFLKDYRSMKEDIKKNYQISSVSGSLKQLGFTEDEKRSDS